MNELAVANWHVKFICWPTITVLVCNVKSVPLLTSRMCNVTSLACTLNWVLPGAVGVMSAWTPAGAETSVSPHTEPSSWVMGFKAAPPMVTFSGANGQ